jgi:hypothetical protein
MQAGRMRHAFIERLTESKQKFRQEMGLKMRSTLDGISLALENGIKQRAHGEEELLGRRQVLSRELLKLDEFGDELKHIRERVNTVCQPPKNPMRKNNEMTIEF